MSENSGHVAWVSYGLRPEQGDENGDFDFPMVFSAGGIGPLNGDIRERRLEYFDIADNASHAPYGMQGKEIHLTSLKRTFVRITRFSIET